jgi:DNA-binding transcriptional MerR regulator
MSFTVGQLAKLTGLTVRALHHYHAIGLLVPLHRSGSGYRLYTRADVVRLYQIQALQRLGLSLTEIDAVLAKHGPSLPEIVAQQIDELSDRIEHAAALRTRLVQLRDLLAQGDEPVASDWLAAVELITQYDQYCSSDELHRLLAQRQRSLGEWPALIADVRAAMTRGVAPESEEAQALAARWRQVIMNNVGGDTTLAIKMKLAYFDQPELQARMEALSGLDSTVEEYVMRVWRHGHLALWARHLDADEVRRLNLPDDRMREWLRVAAQMRSAMNEGADPGSAAVQHVLQQSERLLDEFAAGDRQLRSRMLKALETDPDLQSGWALDPELQAFVDHARASGRTPGVPDA